MSRKCTACAFSIFLFCLCALGVKMSSATCNRRYSPPPDDCTSLDVPCFVYIEEGSGAALQLEHPNDNTRTCYRTCIDDELFMYCEATLTTVHNQPLHMDIDQPQFSLQRIFSPNHNEGSNYRKSTICRYRAACEEGRLLSYSFVTHSLEDRSNDCYDSCIDYVEVYLPGLGEVTTCGFEAEVGAMYTDGVSSMEVEFVANRKEEASGFQIYVWCFDPEFDINSQTPSSRRKRDEDGGEEDSQRGEEGDSDQDDSRQLECAQPSNAPRPTVDAVERLMVAIPDSRADLTSDSAERVVMHEDDTLTYHSRQIKISRGRFAGEEAGTVEMVSSSIRVLYVSNRIEEKRVYRSSVEGYFQGYGELWISGYRAYLLQLGVNPIYKPTDEETEIIMELQMALQEVLKDTDHFDVYDELDAEDPEEEIGGTASNSSTGNSSFDSETLINKALLYGAACNGLLRSVACAYQAKVLNRNCVTGLVIDNSTNITSTEDPTSEPTGTTTGPTGTTTEPTGGTTKPTHEYTKPTEEPTRPTRPTQGTTTPTEQNTRPTRPTRTTRPTRATRATSQTTSGTTSPPRRGRRALNLLQRIASTIRL